MYNCVTNFNTPSTSKSQPIFFMYINFGPTVKAIQNPFSLTIETILYYLFLSLNNGKFPDNNTKIKFETSIR